MLIYAAASSSPPVWSVLRTVRRGRAGGDLVMLFLYLRIAFGVKLKGLACDGIMAVGFYSLCVVQWTVTIMVIVTFVQYQRIVWHFFELLLGWNTGWLAASINMIDLACRSIWSNKKGAASWQASPPHLLIVCDGLDCGATLKILISFLDIFYLFALFW